jgi:hypothetical protein
MTTDQDYPQTWWAKPQRVPCSSACSQSSVGLDWLRRNLSLLTWAQRAHCLAQRCSIILDDNCLVVTTAKSAWGQRHHIGCCFTEMAHSARKNPMCSQPSLNLLPTFTRPPLDLLSNASQQLLSKFTQAPLIPKSSRLAPLCSKCVAFHTHLTSRHVAFRFALREFSPRSRGESVTEHRDTVTS